MKRDFSLAWGTRESAGTEARRSTWVHSSEADGAFKGHRRFVNMPLFRKIKSESSDWSLKRLMVTSGLIMRFWWLSLTYLCTLSVLMCPTEKRISPRYQRAVIRRTNVPLQTQNPKRNGLQLQMEILPAWKDVDCPSSRRRKRHFFLERNAEVAAVHQLLRADKFRKRLHLQSRSFQVFINKTSWSHCLLLLPYLATGEASLFYPKSCQFEAFHHSS